MYLKRFNKSHYYIIKNFRGYRRKYNGQIVIVSETRESSIYMYPRRYAGYSFRIKKRAYRISMRVYFIDGESIRVKRTCLKRLGPRQGELKWAAMSL